MDEKSIDNPASGLPAKDSPDPTALLPATERAEQKDAFPRYLVGFGQLFAGVILPVICFAMGFPNQPDWQSGHPSAYAAILLGHLSSMPQYPFLLYCMTCMSLLFANPKKFRAYAVVQFGIYSGVLVAVEYWLIFQCTVDGPDRALCALFQAFIVLLVGGSWLLMNSEHEDYFKIVYWGALALLLLPLFIMPPLVLFGCLWCSTSLALAAYLVASINLLRSGDRNLRFTLSQLLGTVSWFAAHCSAWRMSYILMLEQYSWLPKTEPERCFVCTAAARGHKRVVHSEEYIASDGSVHRVSDQLRVLKAFELLMMHVSPPGHRVCRWVYDRIGPKLAAMLVHPVLAGVGYFAMKPVEWLALGCLVFLLRGKSGLIYRMYSSVDDYVQS